MKFFPVRAELFQADGQTDMTKLAVAFRNSRTPLNTVSCHRLFAGLFKGKSHILKIKHCSLVIRTTQSCNLKPNCSEVSRGLLQSL